MAVKEKFGKIGRYLFFPVCLKGVLHAERFFSQVNTCVYYNKKVEFLGGTTRVQIYEMWSQGERVACGVITEETKVII